MHAFWQITVSNSLLVALLALGVMLLGRFWKNPAAMHLLWVLVLIKLVTPPLVTLPVRVPLELAALPAPTPAIEEQPAPAADIASGPRAVPPRNRVVYGSNRPVRRPMPAVQPSESAEPAVAAAAPVAEARSLSWLDTAAIVWLGGIGLLVCVRAYRIARFFRLLRAAQSPSAATSDMAEMVASRLGLRRTPRILMLPVRCSPLVWSLGGRPRVVLPAELFERLDPLEQETILAHELAHLRRKDHWVRLVELLVSTFFWWHPAVWLACRQLQALEEQCCDAMVLGTVPHGARTYATALLDTLDFLSERPTTAPLGATAASFSSSLIKRRITMLKNGPAAVHLSLGRLVIIVALAALPLALAFAVEPSYQPEEPAREHQPDAPAKAARPSGVPTPPSVDTKTRKETAVIAPGPPTRRGSATTTVADGGKVIASPDSAKETVDAAIMPYPVREPPPVPAGLAGPAREAYLKGLAHFHKYDFDASVVAFSEVISLAPRLAAGYCCRGIAYHGKNQPDKAITDLTQALKLDPKLIAAYRQRGEAYSEINQINAAIADYTESIRLNPPDVIEDYQGRAYLYWSKRDFHDAIADLSEVIRRAGPDSSEALGGYHQRAEAYLEQGDAAKAIADFEVVLRIYPTWNAYRGRGVAYSRKGQIEKGIADLDEAIRLLTAEQARGGATHMEAFMYPSGFDSSRFKEVIAKASDIIRRNPKDAAAYQQRGRAYVELFDFDNAMPDLTEAIRLNPKDVEAYRGRAAAYIFRHHYMKAIDDATTAIRLDPDNARAYSTRANAYQKVGQIDNAITDCNQSIRLGAKDVDVYLLRASVYLAGRQFEKAIVDYTDLLDVRLKKNPSDVDQFLLHAGETLVGRAVAYMERGDYQNAIADCHKALKLDKHGQWITAYSLLGAIYARMHQWDSAIAACSDAIVPDPMGSSPETATALVIRGSAHVEKGELDRGILDFGRAILSEMLQHDGFDKLGPSARSLLPTSDPYHLRARAYVKKGQTSKALADYARAMQADRKNIENYYNEALQLTPHGAEGHLGRAQVYAAHSELEKAIADYSESIRLDARNAAAYRGRAEAYDDMGDRAKAAADRAQAELLEPRRDSTGGDMSAAPAYGPPRLDLNSGYPGLFGTTGSGSLTVSSNDLADMIAVYRRMLDATPDDVAVLNNLAWLLATYSDGSLRDGREAVRLARRADKLSAGKRPEVLDTLAAAYAEDGKFTEAVATAQKAIELATQENRKKLVAKLKSRLALYQARKPYHEPPSPGNDIPFHEPLPPGNDLVSLPVPSSPESAKGRNASNTSTADRAVARSNGALRANPQTAEAYYRRGDAHARKGDIDEAIFDFCEAIRLKVPDVKTAYRFRAQAYKAKGDFDKAIADYSAVIRFEPESTETVVELLFDYEHRGDAYKAKGDVKEAIADYGEAIRRLPADPAMWIVCYEYGGDGSTIIAGSHWLFLKRGWLYLAAGEVDKAIADADKAIHGDPVLPGGYALRGDARLKQNELDKAIADYDAALTLNADLAETHNNRGVAYQKKGDKARAEADFAEAKRLRPKAKAGRTGAIKGSPFPNDVERAMQLEERTSPARKERERQESSRVRTEVHLGDVDWHLVPTPSGKDSGEKK